MKLRLTAAALSALVLWIAGRAPACASSSESADVVIACNGDRLTGEIKSLSF